MAEKARLTQEERFEKARKIKDEGIQKRTNKNTRAQNAIQRIQLHNDKVLKSIKARDGKYNKDDLLPL